MFAITLLPALFVFAIGLILGSFFNVLIYRLPREESIVKPGSHCTSCGHALRPWENIPVVSYFLLLRGKCSQCKNRISLGYPFIELLTGFSSLILWHFLIVPHRLILWELIPSVVQSTVLLFMIPVFIIDIKHYIIPEILTLPGIALGIALSFLPGGITPFQSLLGIVAGGGFLWVLGFAGKVLFKKDEAMGGGDISLMASVGALWGWQIALGSIGFASLIGSIVGISLILLHALDDDHRLPFGPFLVAGLWFSVFALNKCVALYLGWVHYIVTGYKY